MPVLLPFRAFRSSAPTIYVPGEESPSSLRDTPLVQDSEPALFIYRQRFRFPGDSTESVRDGVLGLLNRTEAEVFLHEETIPSRVSACAELLQSKDCDPGSLWLWCSDPDEKLTALLNVFRAPEFEAQDRFSCLHQLWPVTDRDHIRQLQAALEAKSLFIADGHHRFAAGWNLATIQVSSQALRSRPSHRLVMEAADLRLPVTQPVEDIDFYLASTPSGFWRSVVVTRGHTFRGIEVPSSFRMQVLIRNAAIQPIREVPEAIAAVESGYAQMALLVVPYSIAQVEQNARCGILLPPKSTDFYPKLAAGLVMHRHQNKNCTPPRATNPGVGNPSSKYC